MKRWRITSIRVIFDSATQRPEKKGISCPELEMSWAYLRNNQKVSVIGWL
jgi:hypothetical protein